MRVFGGVIFLTGMGMGMGIETVTGWIDQLSDGDGQAADKLWHHISLRLQKFARQKLDVGTRRQYDENDIANSAFHSLCHGITNGQIHAKNRDAMWGLLAVITSRKVLAKRRYLTRQKRGGGAVRGESGFGQFGEAGINEFNGNCSTPDLLAEMSESCSLLVDAIPDEMIRKIVLLKFEGWSNGEVASELNCTRPTVERKLERVRRIWTEAGLHAGVK